MFHVRCHDLINSYSTFDVDTILSSFPLYYHRIDDNINKTGRTSGAGTGYPSRTSEFISRFKFGSCCPMCVVFWRQLVLSFCLLSFVPVLYIYWYTTCIYYNVLNIHVVCGICKIMISRAQFSFQYQQLTLY